MGASHRVWNRGVSSSDLWFYRINSIARWKIKRRRARTEAGNSKEVTAVIKAGGDGAGTRVVAIRMRCVWRVDIFGS